MGDNNKLFSQIFQLMRIARFIDEILKHAPGDIVNIAGTFTQILILDVGESFDVFFKNARKDIFCRLAIAADFFENIFYKRTVFQNQKMRIKNLRMLNTDFIGDFFL